MKTSKLILIGCVLLMSGCATMFSDTFDEITIKTDPPGAEVYLGVDLIGETPLVHRFERDTFKQARLKLKKEGYESKELRLHRVLDKKSFLNFGFFLTTAGSTCWGIDALSGAMIEYDPKAYFIDLKPNDTTGLNFEDINRRNRIVFTLLNDKSMLKEIAQGDGEYLLAYYSLLYKPKKYDDFLNNLEKNSDYILSLEDGVELFRYLEANIQ